MSRFHHALTLSYNNCVETHIKLGGEVGALLWLPLLTSMQLLLAVVTS